MELALTGQYSSDDFYIDIILQDMKVITARNSAKFDRKTEANRQRKMEEQQLQTIAELYKRGMTQKQIAERIGTT